MRAGFVIVELCVLLLVGCGRLEFQAQSGDGSVGPLDAPIDTPVGAACTADSECGRCARCDSTNHCAVEPINDLFVGHRTTCYIGANGERWCTGENNGGQLGLGDTVNRLAPERALDGGGWSAIYNSYYNAAIGVANGQFYNWGNNTLKPVGVGPSRQVKGVLGDINQLCFWELDGSSNCRNSTGTWTSLSVGGDHTCGVRANGTLFCWGFGRSGALGFTVTTPDTNEITTPTQVGTDTDWVDVVAGGKGISTANGGYEATCARKTDNRIYCWGARELTGLQVDTITPTPVSNDTDWTWLLMHWEHACAGKPDKSVWCWGTDSYAGYVVPGSASVAVPTRIAGTFDRWLQGGHHACGLSNGRWQCFGLNEHGELGIGTATTQPQFVDLCP